MNKFNIGSLLFMGLMAASSTYAQTVNWAAISEQRPNQIRFNAGFEYGLTATLGYGHTFRIGPLPVIAQIDHTMPAGSNFLDDFRTRLGGEIDLLTLGGWHLSGKMYGLYRRYNAEFVRLDNFGADASGQIGYYRRRWMLAAEIGFDKAIVTHFKHSDTYRYHYAQVVDGWYEPDTGGYWYGGLQAGLSFTRHDIFLRGGQYIYEGFDNKPLMPLYLQVGYRYKW